MVEKQKLEVQDKPEGSEVSRRTFLRQSVRGAAMIGSGVLVAGAGLAGGAAEAREKASKAVADYRHYPNGLERCGSCVHYRFPFGCGIVQGPVSFHGWCRFYKARA